MRKFILSAAAILVAFSAGAVVPHRFYVPEVQGYQTLKGDFHIHSRFSDCDTWPTERVKEAAYDGLDFISMTDHLDSRHQHMVKDFGANADENTSYKLALKEANKYGIMVIHGAEITRGTCVIPAHFNVHFIEDATPIAHATEARDNEEWKNEIEKESQGLEAGLKEAKKQNAFCVWNHPDWERQAHNETKWWPLHTRLYKGGLMDGIEIFNQFMGIDPEAFHWAVQKNLAMVSGTDCHSPMFELVDYEKGEYRPMTLVFAKERSVEGIREALEARRTAVVGDGCVWGTESNIKPLLDACLKMEVIKYSGKKVTFKLTNLSSIPIMLKKDKGSEHLIYVRTQRLNEFESETLTVSYEDTRENFKSPSIDVNFYVENWLTDVDKPLKLRYHFDVPEKYFAK